MFLLVMEILCTAVAAVAGIGFGWWLRGSSTNMIAYEDDNDSPDTPPSAEAGGEVDRAGEVLAQLQELTTRVASHVGEHNSRVRAINDELAASGKGQEVVVRAVAKLLEANQKMQQQLDSAEDRLQQQAREIESYATLARTDPLTRLPNRRAFDAEMARQMAESQRIGRPFSLVMIDVDHFKTFNDTYGHQAGDEVLRGVAEVLRQNATGREMAARFGGEEFTVVVPTASVAEAESRVERVREAINSLRFHFADREVRITASLGLSQLLAGETTGELIARADAALYAAKAGGRNCSYRHDGQATHRIRRDTPSQPTRFQPLQQAHVCGPDVKLPDTSGRGASHESAAPGRNDSDLTTRMVFCTVVRQRIAEWQRGGPAPSVVLVHIDDLERLSTTHNERLHDLVLGATAKHLSASVREGDVVANYGDATFALLLPGPGLPSTINIAERLRKAVAESALRLSGAEVRFTTSIGGAEARQGDDSARLLRRSEEALAAAIKSGGNCCYVHNGNWSEMVKPALEAADPPTGQSG